MGAALIPLAATAIGGAAGWFGQQSANNANAQQAQKQMDFQEQMSNTSYQRAVKDMRAAGLNPALAYQNGGASTPNGAQAVMGNKGTAATTGATSAASAANAVAQAEYTKAQTRQLNIESTARLNDLTADVELKKRQGAYVEGPQTNETNSRTYLNNVNKQYLSDTLADRVNQQKQLLTSMTANAQEAQSRATITGLDIPRAQAYNKWYGGLGKYEPQINAAENAAKAIDIPGLLKMLPMFGGEGEAAAGAGMVTKSIGKARQYFKGLP